MGSGYVLEINDLDTITCGVMLGGEEMCIIRNLDAALFQYFTHS